MVIALPPRRSQRRKQAGLHPNLPTVITALSPKEIDKRRRAEALLARVPRVVDHTKPRAPEPDPEACREAADRLWREITRIP